MAVDTYVQLAADGAGKKVRNVQLQMLQPDGSLATVYAQVVAMQDAFGNVIEEFVDYNWQAQVLKELKRIRRCVAFIASSEIGSAKTSIMDVLFDPDERDKTDEDDAAGITSAAADEVNDTDRDEED